MSFQTLESMYRRLADYPFKHLRLIWHGGEPLTLGIEFYEKALALQKDYLQGRIVINSIQTNGTLINNDWCDFFKRNKFSVGVSLDGDKTINSDRVYPNGEEAFADIINGIHLMRINHVNFGILAVISNAIIGHEKEFYLFHRTLTESLRINLVVPYGIGKKNVGFSYEEYMDSISNSLIKLYEIWKKDRSGTSLFSIQPFSEIVKSLINCHVHSCSFSENGCASVLSLSHDGRVYSCGRFSSEEQFLMGNINENSFDEILTSPFGIRRAERKKRISIECSGCEFFRICHGGCAHESFALKGDYYKRTPFCQIYKSLFAHIKQDLIKMGIAIKDSAS